MLAASTGTIPKSPHNGTKWVWINPAVLAPQMKKVKNRTQKTGTFKASFNTDTGIEKSDHTDGWCSATDTSASGSVSLYALSPTSLERFRMKISTRNTENMFTLHAIS